MAVSWSGTEQALGSEQTGLNPHNFIFCPVIYSPRGCVGITIHFFRWVDTRVTRIHGAPSRTILAEKNLVHPAINRMFAAIHKKRRFDGVAPLKVE